MCNVTHILLVIEKEVMRLPFTNVQHHLLPIGDEKDHLSQNVQCRSHPVDYRKMCDVTVFHEMCNVTHSLLVIGKDVMR